VEPKRSWWQQIKIHPVRTLLIALLAVVIVLIILSILGYIFIWDWTGLNATDFSSTPQNITKTITYQPEKTLWDWLQLLIIPAVLAVAGYIINLTISRGEQAATEQRAKSEREATEKHAETEREIAQDNQREAALQEYIDKMSELLLHEKLRESAELDEIVTISRVRTLTVLPRLDAKRKSIVLKFLYESRLNQKTIHKTNVIINLISADLSFADLDNVVLPNIDLHGANLFRAILSFANLNSASLNQATLNIAKLVEVKVHEEMLSEGLPSEVLQRKEALLKGADMSGANLTNAKVTPEQLKKAKSLKGATIV